MLAHRLRRWANIKTALAQCLVFAGNDIMLTNYYAAQRTMNNSFIFIINIHHSPGDSLRNHDVAVFMVVSTDSLV